MMKSRNRYTDGTMTSLTAEAAKRAIYVDFECLKTEPHPTAEILGVLVEKSFEQQIVNPALARAGGRRLRVVDGAAAIMALVQRAEAEDRAIIG